ncbi:hypothetical protein O0L34_g559 [Tuta absoluta]|nr:hypothetical protein O0L34_g559 [Tuta absoluta]
MGPSARAVVLVLAVVAPAIALIKELEPGQVWPERGSVKQPSDWIQNVTDNKEEPIPAAESEQEDAPEENPEIIPKVADLTRDNVEKVDYSGAQVWKIPTSKTGVRSIISRLRRRNLVSTWGGNQTSIDVLVKPNAITNVTRIMRRENITYDVIIEDLQRRIDEENPPLDQNELELQDRRGHRMTWKQYHRLEDIYGFLDYLAKTYPKIANVQTIGKSYEGRELKVLRISNGNPKNKAVFIDGGIHAREWISPATVTFFMNQLVENFDVEDDYMRNIDWYIVPVVNPDGYEYTHRSDRIWRKNRKPGIAGRACYGTDLNRNFGYRWGGKGASANPCSEIFRGSRAFSEPESKAVSDFIKNSGRKFSGYLTYHSYGQYLLYPWGYDNAVPPDYERLQLVGDNIAKAIQQAGGSQYQVGSSSGLLYPAAGGSDDWAKAQGIKYSYTIELSDTGKYGFILPTQFIEPVAKENYVGLKVLAQEINQCGDYCI